MASVPASPSERDGANWRLTSNGTYAMATCSTAIDADPGANPRSCRHVRFPSASIHATAVLMVVLLAAVGCSGPEETDSPADAGDVAPRDAVDIDVNPDGDTHDGHDASHSDIDPPFTPWTRLIGTESFDRAVAVDTDSKGFAYVVGRTQASIGDETFNGGGFDGFLAKFAPEGDREWVRLVGSEQGDLLWDVSVDANDDVYVAGQTSGVWSESSTDGDSDAFLAKFDSSGNRKWIQLVGGASSDRATGVETSANGAIYLTGPTSAGFGGEDFQGGEWDVFTARYNPEGSRVWLDMHGTAGNDVPTALAADESDGLYVVGRTNNLLGDATYGGGPSDGFVVRYDSDGNRRWTRLVGGGGADALRDVELLHSGQIAVAGDTTESFGGTTYHGGETDGFLARFREDGEREWLRSMGSSGRDVLESIASRPTDGFDVAGWTGGDLAERTNAGQSDAFISRFDGSGRRQGVVLFGNVGEDRGLGSAVSEAGPAYVVGGTSRSLNRQTYRGGNSDGFILRYE